ncbi:hypothetical protein HS048_10205 [Planomonospora sp. ID91781]|uniref:NUDIX hydrolase n=1 Tax=Planomonospora sp. ID91781 TaxID=2738135 RepID=UPI0018C3A1B1|nr:hypothetical protein [Planomonospora sp. ID91781]MBG0821104.1 hypothetical protein [Planomonospora sp. ID91781]
MIRYQRDRGGAGRQAQELGHREVLDGILERDEDIESGLIREVREVGLEVEPAALTGVYKERFSSRRRPLRWGAFEKASLAFLPDAST